MKSKSFTKFELKLIVPAKLVGTIVELVEGEGILVEMKPYANQRHSPIHRHHEPGITANDLMLEYIKAATKPFTVKDVEQVFKAKGYAIGTVSSRLSMAKTKKLVKTVGGPRSGLYERVK